MNKLTEPHCNEPVSSCGERLIGLPEVTNLLGVCARTIRREVERGKFPKPVRVGKCLRFCYSEVTAYLNALKAQRA